jgi:DNA-binding winged helix-turn-helix (wHTH) protein/tetratricopeptide (TPR) repeat protein
MSARDHPEPAIEPRSEVRVAVAGRGGGALTMIFRFGPHELDDEAGELRRDGVAIDVQPKPLALLLLLVRNRDRTVPTDEIFDALWPGVAVTPGSLTRAVSFARRAIGDTHRGDLIRNVSKRGYRFTADVITLDSPRSPDAPAESAASAADSGPPFIGRDQALELLRARFADAVSGRGSVVLVTGPAGIGKTRFHEVFAAEAERRGARVLVGRAREGEGVPAFWPWAQLLRSLVARSGDTDSLQDLAGASPELVDLVPELSAHRRAEPHVDLAPEQSRFLLFDAVSRLLARMSAQRPLVLVLEDLQWAGSESCRMLEHLAFEISEQALLVVATSRDEARDPAHPLERFLPRLRQQAVCSEVKLQEFTRREVAALLERTLGRPAPPDLTSELFARTEGVPLFLREAIRLLAERGDLRNPDGVRRWAVTLPPRALDLIRRPLERLSPPCAHLIAAASVLGRDFVVAVAASIADAPRDVALDLLDEAVRAGVIEDISSPPGSYRFTHALFREAAHQSLSSGMRARLHLRTAEELERRHRDDPDRVLAELAHHHHEALAVGDPERAFSFAARAAERASRSFAHEQAAMHRRQAVSALESMDPPDPRRRLEGLLALGDAQRLAADREGRRRAFTQAIEAAISLAQHLAQARAASGLCDLSEWAARDDEASAAIEAALRTVPVDAERERARLLTRFAFLTSRRSPERALPPAREAVERAHRLGDPELLQDALYVLIFVMAGPDHLEERSELGVAVESVVREAGATDTTIITLLDLACDRLTLGDAEGARRLRDFAGESAGAEPHPGRAWHLRVYDSGVALLEGRVTEAERLAAEMESLGRRIQHPYARGVARGVRADLARMRGDEERVLQIYDPVIPARQGPIQFVQTWAGRALAAVGRVREARMMLEDLGSVSFERIPRNIRWSATIVEAAHLLADVEAQDRAEDMLRVLEPVADRHGVLPVLIAYAGPVRFAIGRIHALLGDLDAASDALDAAASSCEAMGARPMLARVRLEQGRVFARRGERQEARKHFAESRELAKVFGMQAVAQAADAALGS